MDLSDSDEDDCQLYTNAGKNFKCIKINEFQAKQRELLEVGLKDLVHKDEVVNVLGDNITNRPYFKDDKSSEKCKSDVIVLEDESFSNQFNFKGAKSSEKCKSDVIVLEDESFSNQFNLKGAKSSEQCKSDVSIITLDEDSGDDNITLAELRRSLRRNRSKRCKNLPPPPKQKRPKRNTTRRSNRRPTTQVTHNDVIVFDDDTGYVENSLPPIDFNSRRSHRKNKKPEEEVSGNLSLGSVINQDFDEVNLANNDLVTITIEWKNGKESTWKQFKLRMYQKFESIFEELASMENISPDQVVLMYDFKSVNPKDTPSSLNLKFYGALIGAVSATEINRKKLSLYHESDIKNMSVRNGEIQVKLLLESKQTLSFTVLKHQKLDILYIKCAEEMKCDKSKIKLTFDGEYVDPNETGLDLEIEDGDVFHVYIKMS